MGHLCEAYDAYDDHGKSTETETREHSFADSDFAAAPHDVERERLLKNGCKVTYVTEVNEERLKAADVE